MSEEMPFWCGRCGFCRVAVRGESCEVCRSRPTLDGTACGICGKPSEFMYVWGFRCREHEMTQKPSQTVEGNGFVGCHGREANQANASGTM